MPKEFKINLLEPPPDVYLEPRMAAQPVKLHKIAEQLILEPEGGMYIKNKGTEYLEKGCPCLDVTGVNDILKKTIRAFIEFTFSAPIKYILPVFFLVPKKVKNKILFNFLDSFTELNYQAFHYYYLKPEYFCTSAREIYNAGHRFRKMYSPNGKMRFMLWRLFMAICMTWEYDNTYRYRGQDICGEVNKEELIANPANEIKRLFQIIEDRTPGKGSLTKRFAKVGKMLYFMLKYSKWFRQGFIDIVKCFDFDKMGLDEADMYYCLDRINYNHEGMTYEEKQTLKPNYSLKAEDFLGR